MSTSGGHAVVQALVDNGVDLAFGIPGTHNLEIYRHLHGSGIRHVAPRHEQGGGYAADAYARVSGRPGVVITTTGPGLMNAVTAAATAYADSIPMLLVSPGMPRGKERADIGWLHEVKDQHAHLDAVVDRSVRVDSAVEAYAAINEAFGRWRSGRPRPVHIEVPVDVLEGEYDPASLATVAVAGAAAPTPEPSAVGAAAAVLASAPSVVMIVGGGARHATHEVRAIAERLDAPVITTVNGKGILAETHPLSLGAAIRLDEAHRIIATAGALLVVGSVLGDDELWGHTVAASGPVVRVDIDERQLDKNLEATHPLHGDAAQTLRLLLDALPAQVDNALGRQAAALRAACDENALREGAPFAPYHAALREALPAETIFAGDSAQVSYFGTAHQWPSLRPGQFVYPAGFATLGYGIPGGIGAALAAPGTPVVVLAGDGGTMFTIQEFATAVDLGLGLPVVVMNNGGFQEIREGMESVGISPIAVDVRSPDFPLLGKALGGEGQRVEGPAELAKAVTEALGRTVPTLIEVSL
ncbi:acetolactate synthase [Planosporangium thailandense]|uniref:Acetolactate synthase n=1 Tax=Planosporangium thailandense TaxID=765197 RepID=A0ABX0Y6M5_9ACTN|nr:acetolactate synthase [Planosporangium thailandense]